MHHDKRRAYINANIIAPGQRLEDPGGVLIEDGWILAVGDKVTRDKVAGAAIIDCKGLSLFPGFIDMRVFTGEPGAEYRETLATASQAAAAGGVTTMIVMPNTNPLIDDAAIVDYVMRRARDTALVRIAPMAAITKGLNGEAMTEIGLLKEAGAVAITDGIKAVANANIFRRALSYARDFNMLCVQHVEEATLARGMMNAGAIAGRLGLSGIPDAAELIMLERDVRLVELTGAPYHAAQISCRGAIEIIRRAKEQGLPISCGVSIHHLTLCEEDIGAYRTFFKLSPPLRTAQDRDHLIEAVADGTIDVIVSAHDPQSADTKRLPFAEAAFGAIGLETLFAQGLSLCHAGQLTLNQLIKALSTNPARLLGLETGRLEPGAPADFVLANLELLWTVEEHTLHSRSKNTPFEHQSFKGRIVETLVAGRSVYAYSSKSNL